VHVQFTYIDNLVNVIDIEHFRCCLLLLIPDLQAVLLVVPPVLLMALLAAVPGCFTNALADWVSSRLHLDSFPSFLETFGVVFSSVFDSSAKVEVSSGSVVSEMDRSAVFS